MPYNIDPSVMVNIPCPACGHKNPMSVAEIETSPRLPCEACGSQFAINASKVMEQLKLVMEKAEMERRRRGF